MNAGESGQRVVKDRCALRSISVHLRHPPVSVFAVARLDEPALAAGRRVVPDAKPPHPERDSEEDESECRREA